MADHDSMNNHRSTPNQQRRTAVGPYFRYDAVTPRWAMAAPSSSPPPEDGDDDGDKENLFSPEHALPASLAFLNSSNIIEDSDEEEDGSNRLHPDAWARIFSSDLVEDKIVDGRGFYKTIKPPPGMDHLRSVVHRTSTLDDNHRHQQQLQQPPNEPPSKQRIKYDTTALTVEPYRPPRFRLGTSKTTSSVSTLRSIPHSKGQQKGYIQAHTSSSTAATSGNTSLYNVPHATKASSSQWAAIRTNNNNDDNNNKHRRNKKVSQKDLLQQYDRLAAGGARKMKPSAVQLRQASGPYQVKLSSLGQVRPHPPPPPAAKQQRPILVIPPSFDDEEGDWPRGATVALEGSTSILQHHQDYPNYYGKEQDTIVPKRLEFTQQLEPQASFLEAMRAGLKLENSPYRRKLNVPERHGRYIPKSTAAVVSPPRSGPIILVDYQSIRDCSMSGEKDAAERSEFLLRQMIDNHARGISGLAPDGGAFNSVLHAYARQGNPVKAEQILDLMWKDFNHGNVSAEPNKRVYTTVMYAWEKSNKKTEAPEACEQLLAQMHELYESGEAPNCKPDLFAYTCILHCWADSKRKDAAVRAEKLFKVMKIRFGQGDEDLRPDTICYSNLINVFLSCGQQISRAEATFWEMVESAISGQNKSAPPTTRNFNTILAGWSKSAKDESPERVERILRRWQVIVASGELNADVKPDTYSYSLLLKTWAKSKRQESLQKLMEAFNWIKRLYNDGDSSARMDTIKYATIIGALTHAKKPERAQEVLLEMVNDHYKDGNSKAKPDAKAFHSVLSCWARPNHNPKLAVKQADNLLRRMWSLFENSSLFGNADNNLRPSTWTYNTVIFCHKNANDPAGAEALLNEMDDMVKAKWMKKGPDETTFQVVHDCWKQSTSVDKFQRMRDLKKEAAKRFGKELSS